MKNSKWLLVAGLVIMMIGVGCKKMGDQADVAGTAANPLILPICMGDQKVLIGHLYVWDDASNLYVKYLLDVDPPAGVEVWLRECQFDVETDSTEFPWTATPQETIIPSKFQYIVEDVQYPFQETTLMIIPNVGGWLTGSTIAAAAHCVLFTNWYGQWQPLSGWACDPNHPFKYGTGECTGWWFPYTLQVKCKGEWHEQTAWGGKAYPDWADWQFPGKNWALYINYNLNASEYVGTLYAGNPKKSPKMPGTVTITDNVVNGVGNIYVTYTITASDWAIFSGHTIVRGTLADIPQTNGNPIPGKFDNFFGPFDPPANQVTVTIPYNPAWGSDLYIGAHAIVAQFY